MRTLRTTRPAALAQAASAPVGVLDQLEPRVLLTGYAPEAALLLDLINTLRADPQAEAARLGVDLNEGLTPDQIALIGPKEPLAFSDPLLNATNAHSEDMLARQFLDFLNPDGLNGQDRAANAGFDGDIRDLVAGGFAEPEAVLTEWLATPTFRAALLSLDTNFRPEFRPTEFGAARVVPPASADNPFDALWSANVGIRDVERNAFGERVGLPPTYALGVAFEDRNANGRYDADEGLAEVNITIVDPDAPLAVLYTATTEATGYYQIELPEGAYEITFTDPVTNATVTRDLTVAGANINSSITAEELNGRIEPESPSGRVARVGADYDTDERLVLASRAGDGTPFLYQQALGGGWAGREVQSLLEGETLLSEFEVINDPKDGRSYAAVASSNGLLLFTNNGGSWDKRNLTQELGARNTTGAITAFVDGQRNIYFAGLDARNDLVIYQQLRDLDNNGDFRFEFRNLAEQDLRPRGLEMPRFTGELISFVTSWNAINIVGLDDTGDIRAVWVAPALNGWTTSNLSDITGAPALSGGLTAYLTSWNGINIGGIDADGDLVVTWWVPSFGGDWRQSNLTTLFDGPTLAPNSVSSYVTPWGGLNVAGMSADGSALEVYWWAPGLSDWNTTRLSSFVDNAPIPAGPITGVTSDQLGRTSLAGVTADGDVVRYFWQPGDAWNAENVSELFNT